MKKILVTGANGQLGNELQLLTKNDDKNVYIFTDVAKLDITDISKIEDIFIKHKFDIVINCAAYTNVDRAEEESELADNVNSVAVKNLSTVCKKYGTFLFQISTDYVFDGSKNTPYKEDDAVSALGVYGITKLKGENSVIASECKSLIIRTSWLYSTFGHNFVKTMRRLTYEKEEISVVFDQVGTPTYAADLANAILEIIESEKYSEYMGVYHYSNEGVCSWYDFAVEINDQLGNLCNIKPCYSTQFPSKVKRPNYSVLDKTKIKNSFGLKIPHWKESLKKCIKQLN